MRISQQLLNSLKDAVNRSARYQPSSITLSQLATFGKTKEENKSFSFLHRELSIRLSHMIKELEMLPDNLRNQPSVKLVESMYWKSFEDLEPFQGLDVNGDQHIYNKFTRRIGEIKIRHATVVETMAEGLMNLKKNSNDRFDPSINYFLDRFYTSRIAIRVLISNHLILFGPIEESPGHYGIIDPSLDVREVVEDAASTAKYLCGHHYVDAPDIEIETYPKGDDNIEVTYIASHLHHMVFEIVKNAMRASVENPVDGEIPTVKITIVKGRHDLAIKVSDRGGGIPMDIHNQLFNYHYSTAPEPEKNSDVPPLAGFGYGLPLSRLYARYLNGNLRLMSVEGYGTEAVIYLQAASEEASEVLPLFNKTSKAKYMMRGMVHDWNVNSKSSDHRDQ